MILIQPWYLSDKLLRNLEFNICLNNNLNNPYITKVVLFCEHECKKEHPKLVKVFTGKRALYNEMLAYAKGIVIIANTDIYFDDTIQLVQSIKEKHCYALSRYDVVGKELVPFHSKDSQDAWIFNNPNLKVGDYGMGMPGCDNRIAREILENGYKITNPCLTVRAIHVHASGYRTYTNKDTVKGTYHFVTPCKL